MTDRDRLIELLHKAEDICDRTLDCDTCKYILSGSCKIVLIADYLLANGVKIPIRCKDCMFYKHTEIGNCMACVRQTAYKKPNDFCSYARLKEREGK